MKLLPSPPPQKLLTSGEPRYRIGMDYASGRDQTVEMRVTYFDLDTDHPREIRRIDKHIVYDGPAHVVFSRWTPWGHLC